MPSLSSLEAPFFHRGVHPLLSLSLVKLQHSPPSRSGALDRRLSSFSFWQERLWRTWQLLSLWHEATLFFSAGPVCPSFSAQACAILQALCWSRQHQQACHFSSLFLLSDSRSDLTTLSSSPSFLLPQTLCQIWQELSSLSSCSTRLQWVPGHSFPRGTTRLMSWPDGERYLRPLQSLVVSLLFSLVSTLLVSRTGGVLSHLNSLTRRFSRFPPRNLCSLVTLAVFSLVYAATDTSLLLSSYLFRIGRIKNPSCSVCEHSSQDISHLILHCPATNSLRRTLFGASLFLYNL